MKSNALPKALKTTPHVSVHQAVMRMLFDPMVPFARFFLGINVNDDNGKVFEVMKQLIPDLFSNRMRGRNRDL